jgi:hypothetical protein
MHVTLSIARGGGRYQAVIVLVGTPIVRKKGVKLVAVASGGPAFGVAAGYLRRLR